MRRFLTKIALSVLMLCGACGFTPALADSPYTVAGVHVDASGASTATARNAAIAAGREEAWQTLFRRLTRQQDWAKQPALSPDQLQKLITSYFPTGERRSTTRYVADVTYIFNQGAVSRILQSSGVAYSAPSSHRVLVVPMAPGYGRASAWTAALANPRFASSMVPFSLPVGDTQDMNRLAGLSFEGARWSDLAEVAARRGANEAVVILAEPDGKKLKLALRRLGPGAQAVRTEAEVAMPATAQSAYPAAAEVAVRVMDDLWKSRSALDFAQRGRITVDVAVPSLDMLASLQRRFGEMPNISGATVMALDIGAARVSLSYQGTLEQLREAFAQGGYSLAQDGGVWHLAVTERTGAP